MPGAITFRPPEYPAIKCGSTNPVTNLRSAFTKCDLAPEVPDELVFYQDEQLSFIASVMIQDADVFRYQGPNELLQFFPEIRTMKACSNQNRNAISWIPPLPVLQ